LTLWEGVWGRERSLEGGASGEVKEGFRRFFSE